MLQWTRRILLAALAALVLVAVAGIAWEQWSRRSVARTFPPPGRLVEHGGERSHLECAGDGSPTVVLEAGLGVAGSRTWSRVQPELASATRVCSYDRAGYLWSEAREGPRHAERIARELHGLLEAASVPPPYVLVGHSIGGLLIRVYDDLFPGEAAGFVFVDASHPEQFERYPPTVTEHLTRRAASLPPPLLFRAWVFVGGYRLTLPAPENAVQAYLWRTVPSGLLGELRARESSFAQAAGTGTLGDRPVVVLTGGAAGGAEELSEEETRRFREVRRTLHAEIAALSSSSDHRVVESAGHSIQRDDPASVAAAVRDVVGAVRGDTAVSDGGEHRP